MLWFLTCVAALIGGYFLYGLAVEKSLASMNNAKPRAHQNRWCRLCTDVDT